MTHSIGSVDRWTLERAGKDGCISGTTKRFGRLLARWQNTTRRRARRTFRRKCQHASATPRIAPVSALTKRRIYRSCWVRRSSTISLRWMRCAPNEWR